MKLERVALAGFLSHTATDWQPNGARLATLVGPNGAGKSSLASDALSYALYDVARGRTDDLVQLGRTDMSATVEWSMDGHRYRVVRGRTVRAGGKSFLELAVQQADGTWRPLTGETIAETEAAIVHLLRLDAGAFKSAVLLAQGQAMAFALARDSERKAILGTVLDLGLYEAAEALARDRARTADAELAAGREQLERLEAALGDEPQHRGAVEFWTAEVASHDAKLAALAAERDRLEAKLTELAGLLADVATAEKERTRLEGSITALAGRYQAAMDRRRAAADAISRATTTLEHAPDVEAAQAAIPALQAAYDQALGKTEDLAHLREKRALAQAGVAELEQPWQAAVAAAAQHRAMLGQDVAHLASVLAGLLPVTCPKCGETFAADPADTAGQLAAKRAALETLTDPPAPARLEVRRTQVFRVDLEISGIVLDPDELTSARDALHAAQVRAAAAEGIETARAALHAADVARVAADEELADISRQGNEARAALTAAQAAAAAGEEMRASQLRAMHSRDEVKAEALDVGRERSGAVAKVAAAQAELDRLVRVRSEHAALAKALAGRELDLGRLRRLVTAFGATGIPARIIESALPELEAHANDLLEALRPGLALAIRAGRAKKDGSGVIDKLDLVVRDDAGERPLAMFSGGEKMSVSLAIAVGLSRLVARRAGTAIRTLVIDEPDGLDADARRAFGQALRTLAHQGELERIVLVSHHQDLAEVGDAVYQVTKSPQGSEVTQLA